MPFTIGDKLALMYTSHGSQRSIARAVGLSHQQVGRLLRANLEGRPQPAIRNLDPDLIELQFQNHILQSAAESKRAEIPFNKRIPVFASRPYLKNQIAADSRTGKKLFQGTPEEVTRYLKGQTVNRRDEFGEIRKSYKADPKILKYLGRANIVGNRAVINHAHWLTNELRNKLLDALAHSGAYHNVTVGSVVNLARYLRQAEKRASVQGLRKTPDQLAAKRELIEQLRHGVDRSLVYIERQPINHQDQYWIDAVKTNIDNELNRKHAGAISENDPSTKFATSVLLQLTPEYANEQYEQYQRQIRTRTKAIRRKGKKRA